MLVIPTQPPSNELELVSRAASKVLSYLDRAQPN